MLLNIAELCTILFKGRTKTSTAIQLHNSIEAEIRLHQLFHAWRKVSRTKVTKLGYILYHIEPNLKNKNTIYEVKR